ncbi:MAG: DEAD/DEAH box helicase [Candidatus Doudnabacteria bacterium]|nr:DEAD/DEAH box helicase [Candidatus Doudnabacteria bacterium]
MKNEEVAPAQVAAEQSTFDGLGIHPTFLGMLERAGFTEPTPIQQQSIPVSVKGEDVLGIAQTGTGKTLAFGIPMVQRLVTEGGTGLVVLPTRELAVQVDRALMRIGKDIGLRTALLIGGEPIGKQHRAVKSNPHIYIATPGRLIDHLEQKTVQLSAVRVLVLDEADRMLDMGFAPQLKRIMQEVPAERQTLLFSATMPDDIVQIAKKFMRTPVRVEVARPGTAASTITQEVIFVHRKEKMGALRMLLQEEPGKTLVFTRTKFGAKKAAKAIRDWGMNSVEIHSNRTLNQRLAALQGFKTGKYQVLVATDIAARGIDASGIALVINLDLPAQAEDYVHRIGRTGRAGRTGKAIAIATLEEKRDVRDIERLIGQMLPVRRLEGIEEIPMVADMPESRGGYRGGSGEQRGGGRYQRSGGGSGYGSGSRNRGSRAPMSQNPFVKPLPSGSSRRGRAQVSRWR